MGRAASLLMKLLGQRYVQYVNKTYRRCGTLWDGRFRSSVAQSARYVLACYRYIEMNPVRANMVQDPADYPWSSHTDNAQDRRAKWRTPHGEYLALGMTAEARCSAYWGLFATELEPGLVRAIRGAAHSGYNMGSPRFRAEIDVAMKEHVVRQPLRPYAVVMP